MANQLNKFILLMWKNLVLQLRHPVQTVLEILVPVLFAILLVVIRSLVDLEDHRAVTYSPYKPRPVLTSSMNIIWLPENAELKQIMEDTITTYGKFVKDIPMKNKEELDKYIANEMNLKSIWAVVDFGNDLIDKDTENIVVTIRFPGELRNGNRFYKNWETQNLFPYYQVAGPRTPRNNAGAAPSYEDEGFLFLQQQLSLSIINHIKMKNRKIPFDKTTAPVIQMQRFSYPEWTTDYLMEGLQSIVGLIFMLSFVYTCVNTVKSITIEKEKQLKEAMKIMGLPGWLHWLAWFIKAFVFLLISVAIMVVLLKIKWYPHTDNTIFTHSDPFLLFIFLMMFMTASIMYCFALSVFFSKANTAATVAGLTWFVSYFPYLLMQQSYDTLSLAQKLASSLLSNTAMAYGFQLVIMFEGNEEGLQWNNIWESVTPDDDLMFGHILIMLIIDTILYLLIALYVEAVFPGEYGIPEVWYFPFTKSYWCGNSNTSYDQAVEEFSVDSKFFEKEPEFLKAGIQIKNLRKEFQNNKVAVKNLCLNMYEDQITVLLGHNGAGKTTTMSMLTGMFPPSSGAAMVNGCDVRTNISGVRESLGLCPQHNILFDELTVNEHIYFYSRLKGLNRKQANMEILKYVELLELQPKANSQSSTLSGGMKRKLSVAIALCGDSSVVMCDEPTAGMDPSARRALWDLLQSQKKGRTILLSTHFMDEADLLGDRIAIMAEGELQCCGSSFFLKKKYGAGYHLIMDISLSCNPKEVTKLFKNYIPNIEIESNIGSELSYILNEEYSPVFEKMLHELETRKQQLGVNTYGISLTTLEEVFMKVGASNHEPKNQTSNLNFDYQLSNSEWKSSEVSRVEIGNTLLEGWPLWRNQILAMFMKRGLSLIRQWVLLLIQYFIPIVLIILAVVSIRNMPGNNDLPDRKLELNAYRNPVTVVTHHGNKYQQAYINILKKGNNEIMDWGDGDMDKLMINETREKTSVVRSRYIIGADFKRDNTITAFFNNNPYHSPPLALQMVMNSILQTEVNEKYTLQFHNFPLPYTAKTKLQELNRGTDGGFTISFNLAFAVAFTSAFYVMFYIRERVCKAKHLQFVSGIGVLPYWCTAFITDMVTFMVKVILIIITFAILQEDGFKTAEDLGTVFAIFLYFAISVLPMMYLASYLFDVPSTGYTRMALFNLLVGVAGFLGVYIISIDALDLKDLADTLHWILLFLPPYTFSSGIRDANLIFSTHNLCNNAIKGCTESSTPYLVCKIMVCMQSPSCCTMTKKYFDMELPGIGRNVIIACCMSIFFFTILMGIEYRLFDQIRHMLSKKRPPPANEADEDSDVAEERKLIRNLPNDKIPHYKLIMRDVTKYYNNFLAVDSICLGVKEQECFGLLGVNGAGKTTTFKMLTGDVPLSDGDAWVNGFNLKTEIKKVHQLIGYCPQFDALLDNLTARETLIFYGLIRGITLNQSKMEAEHLAHEFDFSVHLDKQIRALSGGNKRKLSTAIALIGNPQVIYLDEPTTGMDPATKRYLWDALCKVRDSGKCIILTSHSMEECEALCTRLSIMVNGTFQCLGSTQHLKNKFSEGYTLIIKIKKGTDAEHVADHALNAVEKFVNDNFQSASVREKHQELITFYIADKSISWSKMFGILERGKMSLNIEDYSLGQSSLEQVFLTFTKQQHE